MEHPYRYNTSRGGNVRTVLLQLRRPDGLYISAPQSGIQVATIGMSHFGQIPSDYRRNESHRTPLDIFSKADYSRAGRVQNRVFAENLAGLGSL